MEAAFSAPPPSTLLTSRLRMSRSCPVTGVRFLLGPVREGEPYHAYTLRRLVECDAIRFEDGFVRGVLEPQPSQPQTVSQRPVLPPPAKPASQK